MALRLGFFEELQPSYQKKKECNINIILKQKKIIQKVKISQKNCSYLIDADIIIF